MDLDYTFIKPGPALSDFVESFWMLANPTNTEKEVVVLPDGRFDIFFSCSSKEPFHVTIAGLGSEPSQSAIAPESVIFAVSFKLLALEYLLDTTLSSLVNKVDYLPADFWGITVDDLSDFDGFCARVSDKMIGLLKGNVDERKRKLFDLIYTSQGSLSVSELSEAVHWTSRQINRYFNQWVGISLKTYCNILRYKASFNQIKEGKLFPEQHFTDQAHFIKEVKKFSGVTPKELTQNKNDRFIQFSTLPRK
ncbi:AraC family transcriptional regulator [Spirosoma sp. HMF4905]|uniref:AraC family transcriptional regulator n=1 Tax=Spirosoma arboris TaxID=2682092 RepID=A0A7K1SGD5_9BACT|nr:AraC family transcriptional regulator [Spirosoma arboris]